MFVDILLSTLVKQSMKHCPAYAGQWSPETWLKEHRTVSLGVPRQLGKTTALVNLWRSKPSLLIAHSYLSAVGIRQSHYVECLTPADLKNGRALRCQFPIELILLDEWLNPPNGRMTEFYQFAANLMVRNQLSPNVMIINVGT